MRIFQGHDDKILAIVAMADGRHAISASEDTTLIEWDIESGEVVLRYRGHAAGVNDVAAVPFRGQILSASDDKTVRLWDVRSGIELRPLVGHKDAVNAVAVLPDNCRAVTASSDGTCRVWDIQTGETLWIFRGHSDGVGCLDTLPGGRVVSGGITGELLLWNPVNPDEPAQSLGQIDKLQRIEMNPKVGTVITMSRGGSCQEWSVNSVAAHGEWDGPGDNGMAAALLADGRSVLSGTDDGILRMWDLTSGDASWKALGHGDIGTYTSTLKKPEAVLLDPNSRVLLRAWTGFNEGIVVLTFGRWQARPLWMRRSHCEGS